MTLIYAWAAFPYVWNVVYRLCLLGHDEFNGSQRTAYKVGFVQVGDVHWRYRMVAVRSWTLFRSNDKLLTLFSRPSTRENIEQARYYARREIIVMRTMKPNSHIEQYFI